MAGLQLLGMAWEQIRAKIEETFSVSGAPADGSVTLQKLSPDLLDPAAGVQGVRSLNTAGLFDAAALDSETPSRKAVETAVGLLAKVWRSRHSAGTQISNAAVAATKYLLLNGLTNINEPVTSSTGAAQPWRIGWVAADEGVTGLTTKCKIKGEALVATAAKVTVHIALYKAVIGAKLTLGEEVEGSGFDLALGETANAGVAGEGGEFTVPANGDYALGCTVNGVPAAAIALQARLLVHNV